MGAKAYDIIDDLLNLMEQFTQQHNSDELVIDGDIVEIGSERGDGSTKHLKNVAKKHSLNFYTVDYEQEAYELVRDELEMGENAFQMTGEHFLKNIYPKLKGDFKIKSGASTSTGRISFAYLDNFDYAFPELVVVGKDFLDNQKKTYEDYGIEYNNENSKKAHLEQSKLIHKYASNVCFILFDDTYLEVDGSYGGKGATAISWLEKNGWKRVKNIGGEFQRKHDNYADIDKYPTWRAAQKHCWFLLTNTDAEIKIEKE